MEQLDKESQGAIKKMASERLIGSLIKVGEDEEAVYQMNRQQLMEAWAGVVLEGRDKQPLSELVLQKKRLEFEILKYNQDRDERLKREEQQLLREEEDRQMRKHELKLKEDELNVQRIKNDREQQRQTSLAGRTKFFAEALKHMVGKLPSDPAEIPAFFENLENMFESYEVPDDIKPKILLAHLSDRTKTLTARLTSKQLDDYEEVKKFLLKEFRISPVQLRDRFYSLRKATDETYTMLASKLHNALLYYLKSRDITDDFDKLVSLICADRLKELIPRSCLDYVLAQEKDSWLEHDDLANSVDIYMASHDTSGSIIKTHNATSGVSPGLKSPKPHVSYQTVKTENSAEPKFETKPSREEIMKKGLCFNCLERGHTSKTCPKPKTVKTDKRPTHVSTCTAIPAVPLPVQPLHEPVTRLSGPSSDSVSDDDYFVGDTQHNGSACTSFGGSQYIDADEFHVRSYVDVKIEGLPQQTALIDGGSEICCINETLIQHLNVSVVKQLRVSGLSKNADLVNVVRLHVNPVAEGKHWVNIAPSVRVWFAVVPGLHEAVIMTPTVVSLLQDVARYNVLDPSTSVEGSNGDSVKHESLEGSVSVVHEQTDDSVQADVAVVDVHRDDDDDELNMQDFFDTENPSYEPDVRNADRCTLAVEQRECPSLCEYWKLAKQNKNGFFVEDDLLYHRDTILGHKVKQLCLPEKRVPIVLEMGHDAPFAGHMAVKSTHHRIKLNFWFPKMNDRIKSYCSSCATCQLRTPVKTSDRVPITPIPRDDELPFTHLVMDCIGPILPEGDPAAKKPEYNYALVIVDKYSRWPMAYPLRSLSAKAVCDALLQVFMTFSIPKVISSDCGSNFTSKLTQECLKRLGCCPRFSTPGHPEASGLVERCNQSLKTMIYKLAQSDPRGWFRLLPFVLWSLRERPSCTTHISPFTLVYGGLPRGPLSVLKDSWAGERPLPLSIGRKAEEYLQALKDNLEMARAYADYYSDIEQKRYATHYNLRSTDRQYQLGDKVAVLSPDAGGAKLYNRWQGPGTVVEVKSPYSYIVDLNGKSRHVHANKMKRFNERIEQALINSCSVIFDKDEDFGSVVLVNDHQQGSELPLPSSLIDPAKVSHLTELERSQLFEVLDRYPAVFSDKPGFCSLVEHEIKISADFKPKRLRAYKVPELLKPEVDRQIKEMLELGIIVPSDSGMASPMVCVLKGPNGQNGVRLAVDYRHVNKYSAGDCFLTPDIPDVLQKVGKARYISCFDARSGYWQLPVKKSSRWLTAFMCDAGLFEFQRMPFGLKSASNTFMRCISKILHPIRTFTEPFVDDMSVHSNSWSDHLNHLDKFLVSIHDSGLTLNLNKCTFAQSKAKFVGHVIGSGKIEPDPVKVATVHDIKPPVSKKDVRRLIGFFSYFRSFIPSLAEKAKIITDLTQKHVPNKVPWNREHEKALEILKTDLCNATALHTIDFSKPFGLLVDASAIAVGCCLIQWSAEGIETPVAFASMKLSTTQSRWSTIEREAFAVIWALRKFRSWVFMSKIVIFCDHNPLTFLTDAVPKSAKLARWALALQQFNVEFRYRAGRKNTAADFLSRM